MSDAPLQPQPDPGLLDQSEIDKLLAQTTIEAEQASARVGSAAPTSFYQGKAERYDFRNPVFLSEGELRRLRLLHEEFVRYLASRLSLFLRMEFGLKLAKLTTSGYEKFTESLPDSTHVTLFKAEPLAGVGIMDIHPRLALTIVDRLLGGHGHSVKAERSLTEIETALIEDVIAIFLEEWCGQWKVDDPALRASIIGHENGGRFLQTSPKDAIMLVLALEVSMGDCAELVQIAVPYYTIEPLVKKLQARRQKDSSDAAPAKVVSWQPAYERIVVPVRAEWAALELSLREITSLRVGDVIELPNSICNETRVLLNGSPKFIGTVGLDTDHVAVQLTRKLVPEEPTYAKPDGRKNS
jgi:flagellar motor switch protein FliM